MVKRTLLTMTALSSLILLSPAMHDDAAAMKFNKPMIRIVGPQVRVRIDTRRLVTTAAKKPARNGVAAAGPQPEPPTSPSTAEVVRAAIPPLPPRPRPESHPYNEFDEGGGDTGIGPDTGLPADDKRFDEDLIAMLPETWGKIPFDILEGFGRGAIDGAFDNPPDPVGPFPPGDNGPGDLTDYNPGESIQPGGPYDPNTQDNVPTFFDDPRNPEGGSHDQVPGFFDDPRNPSADNRDQGPTNPSNTINDPRDIASTAGGYFDFSSFGVVSNVPDNDGTSNSVANTGLVNASLEMIISMIPVPRTTAIGDTKTDDEPGSTTGESEPASQPNPDGGWGGEFDVSMCGTFIPMYLCMRGAGGSATPDEMLTQPSETGSIMDTDDGPDLGQEAVTNTGDGSFDSTGSSGGGGGGSGGLDDWRNPGDPKGPGDLEEPGAT